MSPHVVILGGGHGVAAVLRALHDHELVLTVIVTVADDGGSSGALRRRWGSPAVGDMRRSLIALTGEDDSFGRALGAPVTIARFGEHPLGNLVLCSLAKAFGDLETAAEWLSGQLELGARVLPATTQPISLTAAAGGQVIRGESAIGAAKSGIEALSFEPQDPEVPPSVLDAIGEADLVLLGPGSLFTSVLAVGALPDISSALATSAVRVVWICNLKQQIPETAGMSAADHLSALRRHGVRVDAVLFDPAAELHFTSSELDAAQVPGFPYPLVSSVPGRHDPTLLSAALDDLFSSGFSTADTVTRCCVNNCRMAHLTVSPTLMRSRPLGSHGTFGGGERLVGRGPRVIRCVHVRSDAGTRACSAAAEVVAVWAEVLAHRDVQRATVDQPLRHLEDPFGVSLRADHLSPAAVLERRGDDLGRRRRAMIDENDHRDVGRDRIIPGHVDPDRPAALVGGHDLPVRDEDAGDVDRLTDQAAAVSTQVEDQRLGAPSAVRTSVRSSSPEPSGKPVSVRCPMWSWW
jgi:uncharacterized cofD-like protein